MQQPNRRLNEGLRAGDLADFISEVFTVDQYKSKMGEDRDILVLGFRVKEKHPAIDLMEFIEKGYDFVLDADMSPGEELNGDYQVFVEIERTPSLGKQLKELISGLSQASKFYEWKFKYQKESRSVEFNEDTISKYIPMTRDDYDKKILETKTKDIRKFFNQGAVEMTMEADNTLTFKRPFSGNLVAKFISIGKYDLVKDTIPGALDLSEGSQSEIIFLSKFLGNYDIDKIGNRFLIRNGKQAVVIEKDRW